MESDLNRAYVASKRAYETRRAVVSLRDAAIVSIAVGLFAWLLFGVRCLELMPITMVAWVTATWRGGALLRGARRGLFAGVATMLLPMSVLRPCCTPGMVLMDGTCCTLPGICLATGAFVGLSLALLLPRSAPGRRLETAAGMALGVVSVASLKCAELYVGETLGLLGGLLAGVAAAGAARAWLDRAKAPA